MGRKYVYGRMDPQDLSQALYELKITRGEFAKLTGAKDDTVLNWLKGEADIPHWVNVICALLRMPGGLDVARAVTDQVVRDRREREP